LPTIRRRIAKVIDELLPHRQSGANFHHALGDYRAGWIGDAGPVFSN